MADGWARGDPEGIGRACRAAISALDAADPFPAAQGYRTVAQINLAAAQLWTGDVAGARTTLASVLDGHPAGDTALAILGARGQLGYADLLDARLDSASAAASDVLDMAAARGWTTALQTRRAHLTLAWVRLLRGDTTGADRALNAGLATDPEMLTAAALHVAQALVAVSRGRPEAAQHAATAALDLTEGQTQPPFLADELIHMRADIAVLTGATEPFAPTPGADPGSPTLAASRARLLLAAGDLRGAQDLAATVTETGEPATIADLVALVDAWLVRALAADLAGQPLDASSALRRAVEIAGPHPCSRTWDHVREDGPDRVQPGQRPARRLGDAAGPAAERGPHVPASRWPVNWSRPSWAHRWSSSTRSSPRRRWPPRRWPRCTAPGCTTAARSRQDPAPQHRPAGPRRPRRHPDHGSRTGGPQHLGPGGGPARHARRVQHEPRRGAGLLRRGALQHVEAGRTCPRCPGAHRGPAPRPVQQAGADPGVRLRGEDLQRGGHGRRGPGPGA